MPADRHIAAISVSVWLGASLANRALMLGAATAIGSIFALVASVVIAPQPRDELGVRRMVLLAVAFGLVALLLGERAWAGLEPPDAGRWAGEATLVSDPIGAPGGVRVRLKVEGDVLDAYAWGGAAGGLRNRLMGERIELTGTVRPIDDPTPWMASRRVVGRMTVTAVGSWRTGSAMNRVANSVRRTIETGAASLGRDRRALLTGFVYGDDRRQSAVTADDFEAAGLTHLLAVSGQNVAFVLVLAGPALRRVGYRGRFAVILVLLLTFATLTRFEPSVVRASAMAGISALAVVLGRPASSVRVLALAVSALILTDPLIVHAVAFQLSVAASAGILVLSPQIAALLRGPRVFREAVAVTAGAQLAVSPLLVALFGGVPVASLPANVLAGPAAGPVMMWGLTAGWVAGLLPAAWARLVHIPTAVLIGWVEIIASLSAQVPLGELTGTLLALIVAAAIWTVWRPTRARRVVGAVLIFAALAAPGVAGAVQTHATVAVDDGTTLWRGAGFEVLELDGASRIDDVLTALRRAGVARLDLVIARDGGRSMFTLLDQLADRYFIAAVWAPPNHQLPSGESVETERRLDLGRVILLVTATDDGPGGDAELVVTAARRR